MTPADPAPGHGGHPRCGGATRSGGTCTQAAGWGTPHPGVGRCKLHGGSTPTHVAAARQVQAEQVLARVWNPDAAPVTDSVSALQLLLGRLQAAVDVLGAQLTVGEPCEVCGRGDVDLDPVKAAAWIRTVRELRTGLADAERLGIAQRGLEQLEALGGDIAAVVRRILDRLDLSEHQQLVLVPVVVPEELRRVAPALLAGDQEGR